MGKLFLAAAALAALGTTVAAPALAQGCGGPGGMCALPGAATGQQQQSMPGMDMPGMPMTQQAAPGAPAQQAAPGTGTMGGMGMCPCCRQMAMVQPQPGGAQGGMGMGMMGRGGLRPMAPDGGAASPGGDMGMGSTPRPPAGAPPAQ